MNRLTIGLALTALLSSTSLGHEWYPKECCDEGDCHPAACSEIRANAIDLEWQGYRFSKDKVRMSPDGGCHVCIQRKSRWIPEERPLCVFLKASS
jgi:hypothetical protein